MDPLRNFGFLLKDVSRLSSSNFERHAVDLGLTLPQCKVLVYLSRNEGINQIRLAYLTDTDPMTMVRIIDRMEQDGWVERRQGEEDRRERRLYTTARAASAVEQVWAIADRSRAEALAGLSAAERSQLVGLLERIHGNLAALLPGAVDAERNPMPLSPPRKDAKPAPARTKPSRKSS
jgi:MarR family transcriptional regulator, transcriptional regulator for hemolysin